MECCKKCKEIRALIGIFWLNFEILTSFMINNYISGKCLGEQLIKVHAKLVFIETPSRLKLLASCFVFLKIWVSGRKASFRYLLMNMKRSPRLYWEPIIFPIGKKWWTTTSNLSVDLLPTKHSKCSSTKTERLEDASYGAHSPYHHTHSSQSLQLTISAAHAAWCPEVRDVFSHASRVSSLHF